MLLRDLVYTIRDSQYMKTNDAPFKEEEHPRAKGGSHGGEFVKKGSSEISASIKSGKKEKIELKQKNYNKENFSNSDFSKQTIKNKKFDKTNFSNSDFSKASLKNLDFDYCNIKNASFKEAELDDIILPSNLSNVDFTNAKFKNMYIDVIFSNFKDTDFTGVDLSTVLEEPGEISYLLKKGAKIDRANWEGQPIGELLKSKEKILKLKEKLEKEIKAKIKISDNIDTEVYLKKAGINNEFIVNTFGKIKDAKTINIKTTPPDFNYDNSIYTSVKWSADSGRGTAEFSIDPVKKDIHLDLMILSGSLQNKGQGLKVISNLEKLAKKTGTQTLSLEANISIGTYAWPRLGFDFKRKADFIEAKRNIKSILEENNIPLKGKILEKFNNLRTANDIAKFDIGQKFTKRQAGIDNYDVPSKLEMHIGKCALLMMDSFDAIKRL